LEKYKRPKIKNFNPSDHENVYQEIMKNLSPYERNKLLKGYIDDAKINVTHIYLAQLIKEDYIDYVLTVNFDNLMLRALALYNEFPPTYDMAILKDITTTTPKEKSVIYFHGQHHGLWLLNTDEELKKVEEVIPPILHSIKDRIWIFIGYSGSDPIFDQIVKLGRFDKGLYWVTYLDNNPNEIVTNNLLEKDNTNSYIIKGYDSDSFMLKLNNELEISQPEIIKKPFTSLKELLENIVDIDDKEHFEGVRERLEISKRQVDTAIEQFEKGQVKQKQELKKEIDKDLLKREIIDKITKGEFEEKDILEIENKVKQLDDKEIYKSLANLYNNWGNAIADLAELKNDEDLYRESFKKYERATELNPENESAFYNWGITISDLAKLKNDEDLYRESFKKYEKATTINPNDADTFNNWGLAISDLAKLKNDEDLYRESFEKYEKATTLNPSYYAFYNWGIAIYKLAKLKEDEALYRESFKKYEKATTINPNKADAFYNWGTAISELAMLNDDKELYRESFEKYEKAFELGGKSYNLACGYALIQDKANALIFLENALKNKEETIDYIERDEDWDAYRDDPDFIALLDKYRE